ncbi:MAG: sigma 54-interacting transcriptional regulator [Nitrospirae bacterium]|nr:sigma 54-interacting transcriptional regulator [Candidatus Troglogloeales bacterium]
MTRVVIIGAGRGGTALIDILHKDPLVTIVGIADINPNAPALDIARRLKISTTTDYRTLLTAEVDLIIDVTGTKIVHAELDADPRRIEVMGRLSAMFMWQLVQERIKSKAMSEVIRAKYSLENFIWKNEKMREIFHLLPKIAATHATVLIEGESGTGKELMAHAIHQLSLREDKPFIRLNCGALAEGVLESELFGHVKGAFTGAIAHKVGRFELADSGTLFLDEIGELSPATQVKLLRVVQEGEFERVGDAERIKVDVRIIAATNKDLKKAIEQNTFRQDLYYRLCVVPIHLPPLRERKDDIPPLVNHFLQKFNKEMGRKVAHVSLDAIKILTGYDYPGNVRELENIIEHAMVFCTGEMLDAEHLQTEIHRPDQFKEMIKKERPLAAIEREVILKLLNDTHWNYKQTALRLGMSRTTLWRRVKEYELVKAI